MAKALPVELQSAVDLFFARRAPSGAFKKAGTVTVLKSRKRRGTRVRHDLRAYIEATRPE